MRKSMRLAARVGVVSLGISVASIGCGDETPPDEEANSGLGLDGGADTEGGEDDDDDEDDDGAGEGEPLDLGSADDGGGDDVPEACTDEAPAVFEVPNDPTCETEPEVGVFTPEIEWTKYEWVDTPGSRSSVTTPIVAQITDDNFDGVINNDDIPDIIYVTYENQMLRAVSGDGSTEILSVQVGGFDRTTSLAAADIDNDGVVEIMGINNSQQIVTFEHDGTPKWTSQSLTGHMGGHDSGPAISDMNGDGSPEIIAGRAILDASGSLIATGEHGRGTGHGNVSLSFAVDVDGDGQQEVVVGNALYRMDGTAIWHNGQPDGYPAVADFDLDGTPEIVVVWQGNIRLQSSVDGTVLWTASVPGGNGGPPTVADYDGDGLPEIGIAGSSTYTVWEHDGTQKWSNPTQDGSSGITGSAVFDFEGDGVAEVVYADETRLWVYAGQDGSVKLEHTEHSSGTRVEYPIIADVDGDGEVEIAYVNEAYQGNFRGLTVIGDATHSWQPGRKIWNQHAYYITNVDDDGGVPAVAATNWTMYNNFRSGHMGPNDGLKIPGVELFAQDPCEGGCTDGLRTVFVQIGNGGAGQLSTDVDVQVIGIGPDGSESVLDTLTFDPPLAAGQTTQGVPVTVDPEQVVAIRAVGVANETICEPIDAVEIEIPECPILPPAPPPAG